MGQTDWRSASIEYPLSMKNNKNTFTPNRSARPYIYLLGLGIFDIWVSKHAPLTSSFISSARASKIIGGTKVIILFLVLNFIKLNVFWILISPAWLGSKLAVFCSNHSLMSPTMNTLVAAILDYLQLLLIVMEFKDHPQIQFKDYTRFHRDCRLDQRFFSNPKQHSISILVLECFIAKFVCLSLCYPVIML